MDVIADFAHKLLVEVICDILGIPEAHRERFARGSQVSGRLIDPTPLSDEELARPMSALKFHNNISMPCSSFEGMTPEKTSPRIWYTEEAGDKLSDEELTANIMLLFGAGHETTSNLIGNGLLALHNNPEQLALMRMAKSIGQMPSKSFVMTHGSTHLPCVYGEHRILRR